MLNHTEGGLIPADGLHFLATVISELTSVFGSNKNVTPSIMLYSL